MKKNDKQKNPLSGYQPADFFVLRTPLLPGSVLGDIERASNGADGKQVASAIDELLRSLVSQKDVSEGIYLASSSLSESMSQWVAGSESPHTVGVQESLLKYILRMASRCTPFGLFSGCSLGSVGDRTQLELLPRGRNRRHSRLDMTYLLAFAAHLLTDGGIREKVRFHPNSTIYRQGNALRYAESRLRERGRRENCIVEVEDSEGLRAGLEAARGGNVRESIAAEVASAEGVTMEEARQFVDALIDNQVLVSELEPLVTGQEPSRELLRTLEAIAPEHPATRVLAFAEAQLLEFDRAGSGIPVSRYHVLQSQLASVVDRVERGRLFHVDLYKESSTAVVGERVVQDVKMAIDVLERMTPSSDNPDLARFCAAFQARWETAEVPLALALDEERGIGFGSGLLTSDSTPLLEGIVFPSAVAGTLRYGGREAWLVNRLSSLLRDTYVWDLSDDDIASLTARSSRPLPDAFMALFSLVHLERAGREGEPTVVFHDISGPSGANLMGRFCHGLPSLCERVRLHLAQEEELSPDVVFAEVVHLPEGRAGNILARPVLRRYEIPYAGRSGASKESLLPLDDLLVTVRGGRAVLLSRRLGKEIRPRVTAAHNYAATELPVYRFLNSISKDAYQGAIGWDWGPCRTFAFLPRVTYKGVILSVATWNVSRSVMARVAKAPSKMVAVAEMAAQLGLPRWVCLVERDNVLPLDLQNPTCVEILISLSKDIEVVLNEWIGDHDAGAVSSAEGTFSCEVLLPFLRRPGAVSSPSVHRATPAPQAAGEPGSIPQLRRRFSPGSEWTYAKFYCGSSTIDTVLQATGPAVHEWLSSGAIDRWFFIRYSDPEWHLRLRVHGSPAEALVRLGSLGERLIQEGLVWKFQLDTYEREVERYGGEKAMELAERIFHADSEFVLELVSTLARDDDSERQRWLWALIGCDHLLDCFGLNLEGKHESVATARLGFAREFGIDTGFERLFGRLFRRERQTIERILQEPDDARPCSLTRTLRQRRAAIEPLARELGELHRGGQLVVPIGAVIDSLMHMFFNRLLKSEHRRQECILHDLLARTYESRLARTRRQPRPLVDAHHE